MIRWLVLACILLLSLYPTIMRIKVFDDELEYKGRTQMRTMHTNVVRRIYESMYQVEKDPSVHDETSKDTEAHLRKGILAEMDRIKAQAQIESKRMEELARRREEMELMRSAAESEKDGEPPDDADAANGEARTADPGIERIREIIEEDIPTVDKPGDLVFGSLSEKDLQKVHERPSSTVGSKHPSGDDTSAKAGSIIDDELDSEAIEHTKPFVSMQDYGDVVGQSARSLDEVDDDSSATAAESIIDGDLESDSIEHSEPVVSMGDFSNVVDQSVPPLDEANASDRMSISSVERDEKVSTATLDQRDSADASAGQEELVKGEVAEEPEESLVVDTEQSLDTDENEVSEATVPLASGVNASSQSDEHAQASFTDRNHAVEYEQTDAFSLNEKELHGAFQDSADSLLEASQKASAERTLSGSSFETTVESVRDTSNQTVAEKDIGGDNAKLQTRETVLVMDTPNDSPELDMVSDVLLSEETSESRTEGIRPDVAHDEDSSIDRGAAEEEYDDVLNADIKENMMSDAESTLDDEKDNMFSGSIEEESLDDQLSREEASVRGEEEATEGANAWSANPPKMADAPKVTVRRRELDSDVIDFDVLDEEESGTLEASASDDKVNSPSPGVDGDTGIAASMDKETEKASEETLPSKNALPKAGSIADFFQKTSDFEARLNRMKLVEDIQAHESRGEFSTGRSPESGSESMTRGEHNSIGVDAHEGGRFPSSQGSWGFKRRGETTGQDRLSAELLDHDTESPAEPEVNANGPKTVTSRAKSDVPDETLQGIKTPQQKSVNTEFVEGLDDLEKFLEAVDPPDELDVGAAGSSIQEVLVGQGAQILTKRVGLGFRRVRQFVKGRVDHFMSRHRNHDGKFALVTRDQVENAAGRARKTFTRALREARGLLDELIGIGDEFDEDDFTFDQEQYDLERMRQRITPSPTNRQDGASDDDVDAFIRQRLGKIK